MKQWQKMFDIVSILVQTQMPDPKTFKQHFESRHPKSPMPAELVDVQAWRDAE